MTPVDPGVGAGAGPTTFVSGGSQRPADPEPATPAPGLWSRRTTRLAVIACAVVVTALGVNWALLAVTGSLGSPPGAPATVQMRQPGDVEAGAGATTDTEPSGEPAQASGQDPESQPTSGQSEPPGASGAPESSGTGVQPDVVTEVVSAPGTTTSQAPAPPPQQQEPTNPSKPANPGNGRGNPPSNPPGGGGPGNGNGNGPGGG